MVAVMETTADILIARESDFRKEMLVYARVRWELVVRSVCIWLMSWHRCIAQTAIEK